MPFDHREVISLIQEDNTSESLALSLTQKLKELCHLTLRALYFTASPAHITSLNARYSRELHQPNQILLIEGSKVWYITVLANYQDEQNILNEELNRIRYQIQIKIGIVYKQVKNFGVRRTKSKFNPR